MQFHQFSPSLENIDKVVVDGKDCGLGLQLSHWPGNRTPVRYKSDLSVEIALRYLADLDRGIACPYSDIVTNDHYDTDGLLAIWALLNGTESLGHAGALGAAAEAGDFYEFISPQAVQFDLTVRAFESMEKSPVVAE